MRSLFVLAGLLLMAVSAGLTAPPAAAAPALPETVEVSLDQTRINAVVGDVLTVRSRIVNTGAAPTDRMLAHLNVASLDGVYVDLEDWSADVTREISTVAAGSDASLTWQFHAVNVGRFDVYVVLLPGGASSAGTGPLVASQPVHVTVLGRRTLTAGGSLPVAVTVPVLLGLVAAGARLRLRRSG